MTGQETAHGPQHQRDLTRRKVVAAGAGAVVAAGVGGMFAAGAFAGEKAADTRGKTAGEACYRLTSETTEGPYYIDADKLRRDVTEDQEGIPLTLRLKVIDPESCKPLANAAVDIWHCNALGVYSGYEAMGSGGGGGGGGGTPPSGTPTGTPTGAPPDGGGGGNEKPTDDERYLRGTWRTDKKGEVVFRTVFPGWYQGRCVHIHTKVHVNGVWTDAGYEGGTTCHTGQLFFDERSVLAAAEVEPYSTNSRTGPPTGVPTWRSPWSSPRPAPSWPRSGPRGSASSRSPSRRSAASAWRPSSPSSATSRTRRGARTGAVHALGGVDPGGAGGGVRAAHEPGPAGRGRWRHGGGAGSAGRGRGPLTRADAWPAPCRGAGPGPRSRSPGLVRSSHGTGLREQAQGSAGHAG